MTHLRTQFTQFLTIRNYAPSTKVTYLNAVHDLAWHYHRRPDLITYREVQHYLHYLVTKRRLAWATLHLRVCALRCFYHQFLNFPFTEFTIPTPRQPKRLPLIWTPAEIQHLIRTAAVHCHQTETMLMVAYGTGLRLSELCRLQLRDLDPGHHTIWVRQGKGRKDRTALYPPRLRGPLARYIRAYQPASHLFFRAYDRGLTLCPKTFVKRFDKLKERAGLKREGGIHSFRHSFATHLVARGTDIHRVQKLLGHKNIKTTQIYIHLAQSMVLARVASLDLLDFRGIPGVDDDTP